jgi:hypothetical protein
MIGVSVLLLTRQWKTLVNPNFIGGVVIALGFGSTWHLINWLEYGNQFVSHHFGWIIWERFAYGDSAVPNAGPFYFLGYLKDFFENYWPWLPFAIAGCWLFGKKGLRENSDRHLLVVLWVGVILVVLSISNAQYFRYTLPVFPALAIIVSKTLSSWLRPVWKGRILPWLMGAVVFTALVINVTPIELKQATSLRRNSWEVRLLASAIRLNTPGKAVLGNYKLPLWNPRNSILFYSDRWLADPVGQPEQVMASFEKNFQATWLTRIGQFKKLDSQFSGKLYLIQSQGPYAYFTSMQNRDQIRYDFSGGKFR